MQQRLRQLVMGGLAAALVLMTALGPAQATVYVGEDAGVVGIYGKNYLYTDITPVGNWYDITFDHDGWTEDVTPFFWDFEHRYVFKTFSLADAIPMIAKTAVDNGYTLYINSTYINSAYEEGGMVYWEYSDYIPASILHSGVNWLAVDLVDGGGPSGWDFALTDQVPLPPSLLLFGFGLLGLGAARKFNYFKYFLTNDGV